MTCGHIYADDACRAGTRRLPPEGKPSSATAFLRAVACFALAAWSPSADAANASTRRTSISDVRVAPIVASQWNQTTADNMVNGPLCYNYYTPNNDPCGCVALAGAQVMRHYQYPPATVEQRAFSNTNCGIGEAFVTLKSLGGAFDWSKMPRTTDSETPLSERKTIGHLCYDLGVVCGTYYSSFYSETFTDTLAPALRYFGYSDAMSAYESEACSQDDMLRAILSNLDAGRPVVVGSYDKADPDDYGHVMVVDGYGYHDNKLYVHANMGWSGHHDGWYAAPDFSNDVFVLNVIECVVYNTFTTEEHGSLICSGRVLTEAGDPVKDATLQAKSADGNVAATVKSNGKGIYALTLQPGKYAVTASCNGGSTTRTIELEAGVSAETDEAGIFHRYSKVGNKCGEDFTVVAGEDIREESDDGENEDDEGGDEGEVCEGGCEVEPVVEYFGGKFATAFDRTQTVSGAIYGTDGALAGVMQLKTAKAKNGVVKITATMTTMDGKKAKAKAAAIAMPTGSISFKAPIGDMAFAMEADGRFTLKNANYEMREAAIGGVMANGAAKFKLDEAFVLPASGVQTQLLPFEEPFGVSGGKWTFAKGAGVKWAKDKVTKEYGLTVDTGKDGSKSNLSSLKLSYAAKTGLFKGSFKAYALEGDNGKKKLKKYTVNVTGFVIDGAGKGIAKSGKPASGPWSVSVDR